MIRRTSLLAIAVAALTIGCGNARREKALADSLLVVADSARLAAADSARRDSIAIAQAAATKTAGSKTKTGGTALKTGATAAKKDTLAVIGHDSVRRGPIKRLPIDTPRKPPQR